MELRSTFFPRRKWNNSKFTPFNSLNPAFPARFVDAIPEFFIKFLTRKGNIVLDPFSGSNVVGAVAERLQRKWISIEINKIYVVGSAFRFDGVVGSHLQMS